ncbi:putative olfactory receptor 8G2 [Ornithorhynchus anatinus]|uniref:putative olfactory receptor 8G2 n=1 Tax=Ornithorhynchus anatinus TaxID=9258 RepID=UPI0010A83043|nr:putative olfactory receptor 8G2 [Ornithorhynchus anatinus]
MCKFNSPGLQISEPSKMDLWKNHTSATEFILSGFSSYSDVQGTLFMAFLVVYVFTLLGNLGMIILIRKDSQLHLPMYFFISNLSFIDLCCSSNITPNMLVNCLAERKVISYSGCVTQLCLFAAFVTIECYLLAIMAYDRYLAVCNPLLYPTIMSQHLCLELIIGSYVAGILNSTLQTFSVFRLSFCSSNVIHHFFCDIPKLLKLSCSSTFLSEILSSFFSVVVTMSTIVPILASYILILSSILKIQSLDGRFKAFSTCASHLTAVSLFYGTGIFVYVQPMLNSAVDTDQGSSNGHVYHQETISMIYIPP